MKASIIESLLATISKFVDKEVANFTSFSDFDLKEIAKQSSTVCDYSGHG